MEADLSQNSSVHCLDVMVLQTSDPQESDMVNSTRVPKAEITGLSGTIMKRISKKRLGEVPSPLGVYWNNRAVLKGFFAISSKADKWKECDQNLKSLAHMAVASMVGCTWCLDFGYFAARDEELELEKAREVPRWRESDVFTPLERDVMGYAEAMSMTPPTVTDEMSARLSDQLGVAAMVELTAFISLANFITRSNVAFGVESDGFAAACGLKPLAEPTHGPEVASTA
jgi:alkylhydroperoxidase family enzyme